MKPEERNAHMLACPYRTQVMRELSCGKPMGVRYLAEKSGIDVSMMAIILGEMGDNGFILFNGRVSWLTDAGRSAVKEFGMKDLSPFPYNLPGSYS